MRTIYEPLPRQAARPATPRLRAVERISAVAGRRAFSKAVPRAGNASGGGQPGWDPEVQGMGDRPQRLYLFIVQAPVWEAICDVIGKPEWKTDPDYAKPPARLPRLKSIFDTIEAWTMTQTKFEAMDVLNKYDVPCGPILSMKEIAEERSLRATGTVVEVDHPTRGKYLSVGNPIKLSDSISEVKRSPLLGEHTEEVLARRPESGRRAGGPGIGIRRARRRTASSGGVEELPAFRGHHVDKGTFRSLRRPAANVPSIVHPVTDVEIEFSSKS